MAVLRALALDQPQPPHEIRAEVPRALSDLTMRLLSKEPSHRPQTAEEVAAALEKVAGTLRLPLPHDGTPSVPATLARRQIIVIAAALLLLVTVPPAGWYAPAVYRFATNQGQLVIETDDPAVEVTVKQNGKLIKIVDRATGREVTLKAGVYQLELSGDRKNGLKLETDRFTLTRGGKAIVKIWREPPASPSLANVPTLLLPAPDEALVNGRSLAGGGADKSFEFAWEFTWSQVAGADRYQLHVIAGDHKQSERLLETTSTTYHWKQRGVYHNSTVVRYWKVRAHVAGAWQPWSEPRPFRAAEPVVSSLPSAAAAAGDVFVLLRGGDSARHFATLQGAVVAAKSGDTIEIRGNGPFDSSPIQVPADGPTIRAAAGFVPLIRLKSDDPSPALFSCTAGKLILEGLELQLVRKPVANPPGPRLVH